MYGLLMLETLERNILLWVIKTLNLPYNYLFTRNIVWDIQRQIYQEKIKNELKVHLYSFYSNNNKKIYDLLM